MWPYNRPRSTFYFYCFIAVAVIGIIVFSIFIPKLDTSPEIDKPLGYSYHVSIQFDGKHHCSGSLISEKHVLTAAHCVDKFIVDRVPTSRIKVAVGTKKVPGGTIYDTGMITHHGSYDRKIMNNDIAVIWLEQNVVESENVRIILLPDRGKMVHYGQELDGSEFIFDELSELPSWDFENFTRYVVHNNTCQEHFDKQALPGKFCAVKYDGFYEGGDSGSPATVNKKYIIGIFLGGSIRVNRTGSPAILTHVPSYLDFIEKEMSRTD